MVNLLQIIIPGGDLPDGGSLKGQSCKVILGKGRDSQDFDLVGKLRDGSLAYFGNRTIYVPTKERPWIKNIAEERALVLANQLGVDYVLVEYVCEGLQTHDSFSAQFYVETKR